MGCIHNNSINETILNYKQSSGLDVYVIPKQGFNKYYGVLAVNYGSNDNEFIAPGGYKSKVVPDGIAHFLEHKMFEQKYGSILDDYAALGSSPNAYTTFTTTAYLFTASNNVKENIKLLMRNVFNPYFTELGIQKEKEIICQEIKMYEDNPNWRVYFNLLDCLFIKYPAKKEVAGTLKSISEIDKGLLYYCYNTFYQPSNATLVIVGNVKASEVNKIVDQEIDKIEYVKRKTIKRIYPHEPVKLNKAYAEQRLSISMPLFAFGFKDMDIGYDGRDLLKKELETSIVLESLFGRSSSVFNMLYNEGIINNTFSSDYIGEKDYGYSLVAGESKEPMKVYDRIQKIISMDKKIEENRYERIKKKFTGQYISSFDSIEHIGNNFISYKMKNINLFDYLEVLNEIKYEDIARRYKEHLLTDNMAISAIYPL